MDLTSVGRTIVEASYRQAVNDGVKFLDKHFGTRTTWVVEIDRLRLDMFDPHKCILGQLFGDYYEGIKQLAKINDLDPVYMSGSDYGFNVTSWSLEDIDILKSTWLEVLDSCRCIGLSHRNDCPEFVIPL